LKLDEFRQNSKNARIYKFHEIRSNGTKIHADVQPDGDKELKVLSQIFQRV